jgi:malonyl-ACP decarboxylase
MSLLSSEQAIAVTGLGIVSSAGCGVTVFEETLQKGKNHFSLRHYPILSFPVIGAFIPDVNFKDQLNSLEPASLTEIIKISRSAPVNLQFSILAALEAWQMANLMNTKTDASRIAIVVAAQNSSTNYLYQLYPSFLENPDYLTPSYALNFLDTNYVGIISEILEIKGEGLTVGGASASGNTALLRAYDLIASGRHDICLVVGSAADLSPMDLQGFRNIGAMGGLGFESEPEHACRPFDEKHEGFIYGQAAAAIVLESASFVDARKASVLSYFHGGALVLDGNHLSNPTIEGEICAMQMALQTARLPPEKIDYINTHGTSSLLGDKTEIAAIEALFQDSIILNSTKSLTGHCLWSAGIVEAIATIIQIKENFLHPNLNLINPVSKKSTFVKEMSQPFELTYALSNSFGFGGINSSLVFSKAITNS